METEIKFIRGDNHQIKFKFKTQIDIIDEIYFTVKCEHKYPRIKKSLKNGIELIDGWYNIFFVPTDTDNIDCSLTMKYDIQLITGGKKFTVQKGDFILEEDITTPDCEV